jgi:hypothetical protein
MAGTRKIAAILVADIVGYSRLAAADEDRTLSRLGVAALAGLKHLAHVSPIHANEVDRPIEAVSDQIGESRRQKGGELVARHLARRHGEFAMANCARYQPVSGQICEIDSFRLARPTTRKSRQFAWTSWWSGGIRTDGHRGFPLVPA